jgi:DNA-binding CsgD family transcriptional regulator
VSLAAVDRQRIRAARSEQKHELLREDEQGKARRQAHYRQTFGPPQPLTLVQRETLTLIAEGFSNAEIGQRLQLSTDTIQSRIKKILIKLGARNRQHAVALALRRGIIE